MLPESGNDEDARWVAQAIAGDELAFRRIFDRYAPSIRRFLRDQLRNADAADEGTQEAFVRAHRRLNTVSETTRLKPWLFGIARNVAHEQRRVRTHAEMIDEPPSTHTPEGDLLEREATRALDRALCTLDPERREALLLRIDHGLAYEEIARVLEWSLAKVKNEIHRARLELRAQLGNYLEVQS